MRAVYYVRRSDDVKAEAAGSIFLTFLDAVTGFNQLVNTPRTRQMLAIIARSGQFLLIRLTFGPVNGPEDFLMSLIEALPRDPVPNAGSVLSG